MISRLLLVSFLALSFLGGSGHVSAAHAPVYWYRCSVVSHGMAIVSRSCKEFPIRTQKTPVQYWKHCKATSLRSLRVCVRYPEFVRRPARKPVATPTPPPTPVLFSRCIYPQVRVWALQISYAASRTGLPAGFIASVIQAESAGNPYVPSTPNGIGGWDIGLMQFGPGEAAIVGGLYTTDPGGNILTGALYLAYLRDHYAGGSLYLTAAMYNGGAGGWRNAEANGYPQRVWGWYTGSFC